MKKKKGKKPNKRVTILQSYSSQRATRSILHNHMHKSPKSKNFEQARGEGAQFNPNLVIKDLH